METKKYSDELIQKVMEGLHIAVEKLKEEARKNGQPLAVSVDGKPTLVYP